MARRIYNDEHKASVYFTLEVNNGNIKRTARDTGIPENTIRDWRNEWEREGVPQEILSRTEAIAGDFLEQATDVRDLALEELKRQIQRGEVRAAQLVAAVGMLEDKIRLGKGLATSRSETVHTVDAAALRKELEGYVLTALDAEAEREADIIDAEFTEEQPKELGLRVAS